MSPGLSANLSVWLEYVTTIHPVEREFSLTRIKNVLARTTWGSFACPVITVAGTNGKGSCVKLMESILLAADYRVGVYTSPHLFLFNERICVNDMPVNDQQIIESFCEIDRLRGEISLTFFEFATLAALRIFSQISLDAIILEVGLGGRLDAVNAVDTDLAVITNIDLDHCDVLGSDRALIAIEKAGIARHAKPVVCGDPCVPDSLVNAINQCGAPLYLIHRDFSYENPHEAWSWSSALIHYEKLPIPTLKLQNAATSLMAINLLHAVLPVSEEQVMVGLEQACLIGRREFRSKPIHCWLDVAHNPQATLWLAEAVRSRALSGKVRAVFSMLQDKNIQASVQNLIPWVDEWYIAALPTPRVATTKHLYDCLVAQSAKACYAFDTIDQAVEQALKNSENAEDCLIVFGSFYTVAAGYNCLSKEGF